MPLNNCKCGHSKEDHIYHEGACRPGFSCPCQKFDAVVTGSHSDQEIEITFKMPRWKWSALESVIDQAIDELDGVASLDKIVILMEVFNKISEARNDRKCSF